jgi:tRNA (cytidine/uridine-2'-O-)-methyltransferase
MFHIVLFQPEIPPNTGNVVRLAANTGCQLHLVEPLGFDISDRAVRRAGLDYAEFTTVLVHKDWETCLAALQGRRIFALTTRGTRQHCATQFMSGDALLFGRETSGLPDSVLAGIPPGQRIRLPMANNTRSLNLSNSVAVVVYEAWRQLGFAGGR